MCLILKLLWFYVNFPGQENVPCPEGWFLCECSQSCIPPNEGDDPENPFSAVCNGKNDCCGTIHGVLSHTFPKKCADPAKGANYTALDEENCSVECAEGEIQCLHENDFPLPLKCIPEEEVAEKRCNGVNDCGTVGANDEIQETGEECNMVCQAGQLQCFHGGNRNPLPLECISIHQRCD